MTMDWYFETVECTDNSSGMHHGNCPLELITLFLVFASIKTMFMIFLCCVNSPGWYLPAWVYGLLLTNPVLDLTPFQISMFTSTPEVLLLLHIHIHSYGTLVDMEL